MTPEQREIAALRELVRGLQGLLAAYRTVSRRTPEKALQRIESATASLTALGVEVPTP